MKGEGVTSLVEVLGIFVFWKVIADRHEMGNPSLAYVATHTCHVQRKRTFKIQLYK